MIAHRKPHGCHFGYDHGASKCNVVLEPNLQEHPLQPTWIDLCQREIVKRQNVWTAYRRCYASWSLTRSDFTVNVPSPKSFGQQQWWRTLGPIVSVSNESHDYFRVHHRVEPVHNSLPDRAIHNHMFDDGLAVCTPNPPLFGLTSAPRDASTREAVVVLFNR